jgi:hypothetical protein
MQGSALVSAEDENLHTPGSDELWSESFYLNFSDSSGPLGGFLRLAIHPSKKQSEGLVCVYLPEGGVGVTLVSGAVESSGGVVRVGALSWECLRPLEKWRVQFQGDLQVYTDLRLLSRALEPDGKQHETRHVVLDLEIAGLHPPFFYPDYRKVNSPPPYKQRQTSFGAKVARALRRPAEVRSALRMRGGRHYEQSLRIQGSIQFDSERLPFQGSGHRDHSWGSRDWMPSHRWRWLTGQLEDLAFNAMYLTIAGTHVINGYVWHDGRCDALESLVLDYSFDDTGLAARDICAAMKAGGKEFLVTGNVSFNVPLPIAGKDYFTMYNVGRARYRCGDRVGYGVAEFLERLKP